jgi:hypothetical protein
MGGFFQAQRLPSGYMAGFGMGQDGSDPDHDLIIYSGVCRSADNTQDCYATFSGGAYIKRGDAAFAEGTNAGMQESGSDFAASTIYYVKLIRKNSNPSVFDCCCGTSATTAPSGWTFMNLLDVIITDAAANMYHMAIYPTPGGRGVEHRFDSPLTPYSGVNPGTSRVFLVTPTHFPHVPDMTGLTIGSGRIFGNAELDDATPVGTTYLWIRGNDDFNEAASANNYDIEVSSSARRYCTFDVPFHQALAYRLNQSTADHTVTIRIRGYVFNRVRTLV